jgi:hypothetical protein
MNSRDLEQVGVFRRYLMERADRSRSRLMRDQIRRWVEWVDAMRKHELDERRTANEEMNIAGMIKIWRSVWESKPHQLPTPRENNDLAQRAGGIRRR